MFFIPKFHIKPTFTEQQFGGELTSFHNIPKYLRQSGNNKGCHADVN